MASCQVDQQNIEQNIEQKSSWMDVDGCSFLTFSAFLCGPGLSRVVAQQCLDLWMFIGYDMDLSWDIGISNHE